MFHTYEISLIDLFLLFLLFFFLQAHALLYPRIASIMTRVIMLTVQTFAFAATIASLDSAFDCSKVSEEQC